jgi:hypothetical protein
VEVGPKNERTVIAAKGFGDAAFSEETVGSVEFVSGEHRRERRKRTRDLPLVTRTRRK